MRAAVIASVSLLVLGCASSAPEAEPGTPAPEPPPVPLAILPLAGQKVLVLPNTYVVAEEGAEPAETRAATLAWSDSLLGEFLLTYAPEVSWTLPPELRRVAARAPGMAGDPDKMGQAILRNDRLETVPDPLRSSLRTLAAIADARYVLVPAAVGFSVGDTAIEARVHAVLVDVRTGQMPWRQIGRGSGGLPADAYEAALLTLLPHEDDAP